MKLFIAAIICALGLAAGAVPAVVTAQEGVPAPSLTAQLSVDYRSVALQWTGVPGPTGVFLIERSITGSESAPREWQGLADVTVEGQGGAAPDANPATVGYGDDDVESAGWYCYRVRAKADDFAWSNEACVVRPVVDGPPPAGSDLPVPTSVRWESIVQPPDMVGVLRIFSWDWPEDGGVDAVIEASVPPRFSDIQPPYVEYARIAATELPRISVTTLDWRGPYCFRVRFAAGDQLGEPSAAACVPRTEVTAPYDIGQITLHRFTSPAAVEISWEYLFLPTTVEIQRSPEMAGEARSWQTIAEGVPARSDGLTGRFVDHNPPAGTACYRVKASRGGIGEFDEDSAWSPESCIPVAPPIIDGPFPPEVGNSPHVGLGQPRDYTLGALSLSAALAAFATATWWATRRSS